MTLYVHMYLIQILEAEMQYSYSVINRQKILICNIQDFMFLFL